MRKIHRRACQLIAAMIVVPAIGTSSAVAQDTNYSSGFSLPGVSLPSGHDEVRAADGTTCRSAVVGSGAYLDIGIIGDPQNLGSGQSAYGRIVIPLGLKRRQRLDCSKLYQLEVDRLATELKLMQMGLSAGVETPDASEIAAGSNEFNDDGWSTAGLNE
ncbi:MAG: hypothetical protein AAFY99_12905 [Pseudomonadota bacterium]